MAIVQVLTYRFLIIRFKNLLYFYGLPAISILYLMS